MRLMGVRGPWEQSLRVICIIKGNALYFFTDEVMHYIFDIIFIDLFRLRDLLEIYDFGIIFIDLFRFRDYLKSMILKSCHRVSLCIF